MTMMTPSPHRSSPVSKAFTGDDDWPQGWPLARKDRVVRTQGAPTRQGADCWILVDRFFDAIAHCDPDVVAASYANDATIANPIAGSLSGAEAKIAWTAFMRSAARLSVSYTIVWIAGDLAEVEWEAMFVGVNSNRTVIIDGVTQLEFDDDLIIAQHDHFSLTDWSWQALGWKGGLLALLPGWRGYLHGETRRVLDLGKVDQP